MTGNYEAEQFTCDADFIIDATGGANPLGIKHMTIRTFVQTLKLYIRTLHGVTPWGDTCTTNHRIAPIPCHDSALHHVFSGGWMYVLHFDNGLTSAGFVLDCEARPNDTWESLMNELPFVKEQFQHAKPTMPLFQTERIQRCAAQMVGKNWAMLPYTAAFLDPLHSTGNAHTLCGIERLMPIIAERKKSRKELLLEYQSTSMHEIDLLDKIIHGCYKCFDNFDALSNYAMLYFAGADFTERQRRVGKSTGFLNSSDPAYCALVDRFYNQVLAEKLDTNDLEREITPWNLVGLCDPAKQNMYDYA